MMDRMGGVWAALALLVQSGAALAEASYTLSTTPGKLPKTVVPRQYEVRLQPDLANRTLRGTETIEIEVLTATSSITLNAAEVAIDSASLEGQRLPSLQLVPLIDVAAQTLRFNLDAPLAAGRYRLQLAFRGMVHRDARGLFELGYRSADGADKTLLATQMEPTDARRMLPCWDEPAFRASFKLSVDVADGLAAYSNMPIESTEPLGDGLHRVTFHATPPMSSYLLALVVGELERTSIDQDGLQIGIVTSAGKQGATAYALTASRQLLPFYNEYFGLAYPLPKLDQIALPGGVANAMENWGAIVYNESALLVDPLHSPESSRVRVFHMTSHEMAHQWFGNLVTMAWWDNLWLNEGFAAWLSNKAITRFHPEWRPQLVQAADRDEVMAMDALATSHAVQRPVANESQAASAFDGITYVKGQAVLGMLESYLGEESFRRGVSSYLARHRYSNSTSADLWDALSSAAATPVAQMAASWTTQPGFPLIDVHQQCIGGQRMIRLSQRPYGQGDAGRRWQVPLTLAELDGGRQTLLLDQAGTVLMLPSCASVLLLDPDGVGYYRVRYDQAGFDALAARWAKLPDTTRYRLLVDAWNLAASGGGSLKNYLTLLDRLGDEPRLLVWQAAIAGLETLNAYAKGHPEQRRLRRTMQAILAQKMRSLGWADRLEDSIEQRQLRYLLATAMARAGDVAAIAMAQSLFSQFLTEPEKVAPAALDFVMSVNGWYGDAATYAALTRLAMHSTSMEQRRRYVLALAGARQPALAARTLALARDPALPAPLANRILPAVAAAGFIDQAWTFALAHREVLQKNSAASGGQHLLSDLFAHADSGRHAAMLLAEARKEGDADMLAAAQRVADAIDQRAQQKRRLRAQLDARMGR